MLIYFQERPGISVLPAVQVWGGHSIPEDFLKLIHVSCFNTWVYIKFAVYEPVFDRQADSGFAAAEIAVICRFYGYWAAFDAVIPLRVVNSRVKNRKRLCLSHLPSIKRENSI